MCVRILLSKNWYIHNTGATGLVGILHGRVQLSLYYRLTDVEKSATNVRKLDCKT